VWALVRRIPRGQVATYGQLAALLGRPRGARMVGWAMRECPGDVPWHRVVNASGGISRRARMESMLTQRMLLIREGVPLRGGRVPLKRYRWQQPKSEERHGSAGARRTFGGRGGPVARPPIPENLR
jgi:methylated-DNA-protein-cysteine methyltransferase related protein